MKNRLVSFDIIKFRELGIAIIVLLIIIVATAIQPRFFSYNNIQSILLFLPLLITVSAGEMMVIVSKNFDLSVGSILGFSGIAVGLVFVRFPDFPIVLAFILGMLIGAALGVVNGLLVTKLHLSSIIVTLGTLNIFRGLLYIASGGRQINTYELPEELIRASQTSPIKIPWIIIVAVLIAFVCYLFLRNTHWGREIYAVGSNAEASKLRGINNDRIVIMVFVISGALSGIAGVMYASRYGMLNPNQTGVGFEFMILAAVVIGGVSVNGGVGSMIGAVFGCVLLGVVNTALAVLGISAFWQQATYGAIIVLALVADKLIGSNMGRAEAWRRSGGL